MSYVGIPPFGQTVRTVTTITASASQTTFTPTGGYIVGYVDVYYNGVKLVDGDDYTATNGSTVTLTTAANAGDSVELVSYMPVSLADTYRQAEADSRFVNVTGDTMSGDLTLNKWNVPRKTWTSIATFGTTNKDWSLYSEWENNTDTVTIGNNTDSRNVLNLYSAGYVTMPYQPAFRGYVNLDQTTAGEMLSNWIIQYNRGNHFSGGRLTAPVAGVYHVSAAIDANGSPSRVKICVNGSTMAMNEPTITSDGWETINITTDVYCNASDYISLFVDNGTGANPYHMGGGYWGWFNIHFVG